MAETLLVMFRRGDVLAPDSVADILASVPGVDVLDVSPGTVVLSGEGVLCVHIARGEVVEEEAQEIAAAYASSPDEASWLAECNQRFEIDFDPEYARMEINGLLLVAERLAAFVGGRIFDPQLETFY